MSKEKKPNRYTVQWWIWNGSNFELHALEVQPVSITKCPKYRFFRVKNPIKNPKPGREWIIAEGGTGYVLAYGPERQAVLKAARNRFLFEHEGICQADISQYIQGHLDLLLRYVGDTPGFTRPAVGINVHPVLKCGELLASQMI